METRTEKNWQEVITGFQQVCVLKRKGNESEASKVLSSELPGRIANWSKNSSKPVTEKKVELETMFRSQKQKVDDAWVFNQLVTEHWKEDLIPQLCATVTATVAREVQRAVSQQFAIQAIEQKPVETPSMRPVRGPKIAFDDVAGIIDLIRSQERQETKPRPEKHLPVPA